VGRVSSSGPREYGRLRAAQGLPLESLIDVPRGPIAAPTIELLSRPIQGKPHYEEITLPGRRGPASRT
jgi:hypothetical protein